MNFKRKKVSYATFFCLAVSFLLLYLFLDQNILTKRTYSDMQSQLEEMKSCNIAIISKTGKDDGCFSYNVGASGVVIAQDSCGYYAITACHVVDKESTSFLIMTIYDPSIFDFRKSNPEISITSTSEYYSMFPEAEVLYKNEVSDLAVIYFECNNKLSIAPIAPENPQSRDKIVCVGTYAEKTQYFVETCGTIVNEKIAPFHTEDGMTDTLVMKHNAFIKEGFSGGAVFNEKLELVGMNIGGQTNIFGIFRYGVMIPCETIIQSINAICNNPGF